MQYKTILFFLALLAIGCKEKTDTALPEIGDEIIVSMSHNANGAAMILNSETYTLAAGTEVIPKRLSYILSNFYLIDIHEDTIKLQDQYALIDVHRDRTSFTLKNVPNGSYNAVGFSLGLDSIINHADPNSYPVDHPLSSVNNALHWDWTSGYIFIAIEGKLADLTKSYLYHVAGDANRVDYTLKTDFKKEEAKLNANIHLNYDEIFRDPVVFDMEKDGMTIHSESGPVTTALVSNMHNLFSVHSIK